LLLFGMMRSIRTSSSDQPGLSHTSLGILE
jgi:hypothetical protein